MPHSVAAALAGDVIEWGAENWRLLLRRVSPVLAHRVFSQRCGASSVSRVKRT
jgi:hypothetical protein